MRQAPRAIPGQPYGQAGAQLQAQQAIPLPAQGPPPSAGGTAAAPSAPAPGGAPPLTPINAPTQRPGEPLTTGITGGAGPGPEALQGGINPNEDPTIATLKGILSRYPNADLRALVTEAESR